MAEKDGEQQERYQRVMQLIPTPIGICSLTEKQYCLDGVLSFINACLLK